MPSKSSRQPVASDARIHALASKFVDRVRGAEAAKRFNTNTTRAATAARELKELLDHLPFEQREAVAFDIEVLGQAAGVLASYSRALEVAKRNAATAASARQKKNEIERAAAVTAAIEKLFGLTPDSDEVKIMANDLVKFVNTVTPWAQQTKHVDKALFDIDDSAISSELRYENVTSIARAIGAAKVRAISTGGRHDNSNGERWWFAGWDDFIAWRNQK